MGNFITRKDGGKPPGGFCGAPPREMVTHSHGLQGGTFDSQTSNSNVDRVRAPGRAELGACPEDKFSSATYAMRKLFSDGAPGLKARLGLVYAVVLALNGGAWLSAVTIFYGSPTLLGVALMIYGLGLRHAVDADHIAAIDNVTRKLMQENKRPVAVGFFFAVGHSTIITIAAAIIAKASTTLNHFQDLRSVGGLFSASISSFFLFAIAAMNIAIFISVYRTWRHVRTGGIYVEEDLNILLTGRGLLSRIFRPLFRLVTQSWQMFLLGFLFGVGFDTATEMAMFGVSAMQMAKGASFAAVLIFPLLFAAGMSLIDTTDGVMMLGAYDWAFVKPLRKLYYNMTITLVSVVVAILIGGVEALGLVAGMFAKTGRFWKTVIVINNSFGELGFFIIAIFLGAWVASFAIYRFRKFDELNTVVASNYHANVPPK